MQVETRRNNRRKYPPYRDEIERRRHLGGCAIICGSVVGALAVTLSATALARIAGWAVAGQVAVFAALINAAIASDGSAIGGWASEEDVVARAIMGVLAAGFGLLLYGIGYAFLSCAGLA